MEEDGRTEEEDGQTDLHFLSCVPALLDATKNILTPVGQPPVALECAGQVRESKVSNYL